MARGALGLLWGCLWGCMGLSLGFDPTPLTCYKCPFCAGRFGGGLSYPGLAGAECSDAAKLSTPSSLAVEACSEFWRNHS